MSPFIPKYSVTIGLLIAAGLGWTALAQAPGAAQQGGGGQSTLTPGEIALYFGRQELPTRVNGEVLVRLAAGADAEAITRHFGIEVKRKLHFAPNTYLFSGIQGDLDAAVAALKQTHGVIEASPNAVFRPLAFPRVVPSDPLLTQQWTLQVEGAREMWGITVGERLQDGPVKEVVVGLVDTGCEISHPDLAENIQPGGFDFTLDQPYDDSAIDFFGVIGETHGTSMAGCIAPVTNNFTGIAGAPWEGVKILPARTTLILTVGNVQFAAIDSASLVDAIYFCIENEVDIISMSLGYSPFLPPIPLIVQAVRDAYAQGIVLVAASGNSRTQFGTPGIGLPANLPEVIAVGAVGPNGELSSFSDGGPELDIMAPGGNDSGSGFGGGIIFSDPTRQVLSTDSGFTFFPGLPPGYGFGQGTSQATAFTSGAIATLISQGARDESLPATEQVERIKQYLYRTARNPFGRFTTDFGNGILNVDAALREFSPHVDLITPTVNEVTASFAEPVEAFVVRPVILPANSGVPGAYVRTLSPLFNDGESFQLLQNQNDVTESVLIPNPNNGGILYEPDTETRFGIGLNSINITVQDALFPDVIRSMEGPAVGRIPERAFRIRVEPRVESPGLKMLSLPYQLQDGTDSLSFLYGGNLVRLARWLPEENRYAIFSAEGSPQDPEADLTTGNAGVAQPPIGVGFFARVVQPTQVQLLGRSFRGSVYRIPIKPGFNLIGNPFPFRVPWSVVNVRFGNEVMSITEAVRRNLMEGAIWRLEDGRYTFQTLPNGQLVDWEAHWVRSFQNLELLIPRVQSVFAGTASIGRPAATVAAAGKGWESSIRLAAGGKPAAEVILGASTAARDGYGPEDVATPPAVEGAPDLRVRHRDWGGFSGGYTRDIRSARSRTQTWTLQVETSKAGTPVQLAWDRFPAGKRAYLKVAGRSGVHDLSRRGALRFTADRPGVHTVTVVAAS